MVAKEDADPDWIVDGIKDVLAQILIFYPFLRTSKWRTWPPCHGLHLQQQWLPERHPFLLWPLSGTEAAGVMVPWPLSGTGAQQSPLCPGWQQFTLQQAWGHLEDQVPQYCRPS